MSEHRRKPPQRGRRAAQPPSGGRRAAQPQGATTSSYGAADAGPAAGGRAEARRAAQRGRRRGAESTEHASTGAAGTRRGRRADASAAAASGKKRLIDYPRSGKSGIRRWLPSWKQVAATCIGFIALLLGLAGIAYAWVDVPDENEAAKAQNNVYYWEDDKIMGREGETNRQNVEIEEIPKSMQNAVIAAENQSFYDDPGIDPKGIARAVFNMARGQETQGGSTITQQFVKNSRLSQEQTLQRKVSELFISIKAGTEMSKDKILQGYLNTSYYGRNAYGIQAAAQAYYNKDAVDLEPDESALLATVLKGADLYDPAGGVGPYSSAKENRERAEKRWKWVLDRQVEVGRMTQKDRAEYTEFPVPQDRQDQSGKAGQVGYLMDIARSEVLSKTNISKERFDRGGYKIYTTFERKKVDQLETSVKRVRKENLDTDKREVDKHVQFGAASVVPGDGRIVAVYGGEGFDKGHYSNNANTLGVPVGSTWKPFVLAAAMEKGTAQSGGDGISPESKYNGDNKIAIKKQDGTDYLDSKNEVFRQVNMNDKDWGPISLRKAMEVSANTPFVQLGMDVGMGEVRDTAMAAGIKKESTDPNLNPSFALGTSTPSAIRMADAYATFAASGTQTEPYSVTRVVSDGEDLEGFDKPTKRSAIDSNVADNVTDVLQDVIQGEEGSGKAAKALNRPAAGKTGTTDRNESAWWVGYTPQLSTSVAMFRSDPKDGTPLSMRGVGGFPAINGGALPTEVWTEYMTAALKNKKPEKFPEPSAIDNVNDSDGVPTPTPTPEPEPEPEPEPDPTPSETEDEPTGEPTEPTESPSPSDPEPCPPWDQDCNDDEGTVNEGPDGGPEGGTDVGTSGDPGGSGGPGGNPGGFISGMRDRDN